jgi:predicted nucleotidyltransferase component of viral defense system
MKDYALELASKKTDYNSKVNTMREYLQAYILRIMHDKGVFRSTSFLGGTALRFLHGLPRFSEDLDFSSVQKGAVDFSGLMKKIKDELILAGYDVNVTYNEKKTVQSAFVKFAGLLFEAGVSPLKSQKFSIKIEIDTDPPEGALLETSVVNIYFPVSFLTYDLPSLFAGKLHALLSREYVKGRDYFDLGWYLSRWKDIRPNILLLTNALKQTKWTGKMPSEDNWRNLIFEVVDQADWKKIREDVDSFLENPKDLEIFSKENVLSLLGHEGKK